MSGSIIKLYSLRFDIQLINKGIDFIGILNENCPSNTWYAHERAQKNRQKKYPISLLGLTGLRTYTCMYSYLKICYFGVPYILGLNGIRKYLLGRSLCLHT